MITNESPPQRIFAFCAHSAGERFMAVFGSHSEHVACPACDSLKLLVVAASATVASLYCLACDHLFAAPVAPAQEDTQTVEQSVAQSSPAHAVRQLAAWRGNTGNTT
jgi:hypothetical protein